MSPSFTKGYWPVHQKESGRESEDEEALNETSTNFSFHHISSRTSFWTVWTRWLPWVLVPCLLVSNWYTWAELKASNPSNAVFSPAQSAIQYKNVVFSAGIDGDTSPYQGWPTPENDQLWEELFQFGVSQIPMSDAIQLANRTSPLPNEPGQYVVILDVFHQLHCLNHIRKRIFRNETESPNEEPGMSMKHTDHCIDSIRQSLMCSSDVTPLPYAWWSDYQQTLPVAATQHTCRDFDAIRDWAKERRAPQFDKDVQVDNPLGNVVYVP